MINGWQTLLLAFAVFLVSFFSVVSGGSGLLTRPLLILAGFAPSIAIGTFRVANLLTRLMGFFSMVGKRDVRMDWKLAIFLFIPSFVGGIIGALSLSLLDENLIKKVLGIFLLLVATFLLFHQEIGLEDRPYESKKWRTAVGSSATVGIGILSAFLGASGILFGYLMLFVYNKSYFSSAAIRKIANFGSALSAAAVFLWQGNVDWKLAGILLVSGGLGEYLGARYQIAKGQNWVRRISLVIVYVAALLLLF